MRFWHVTHAHHNASCLHIIHVGLCMEHLNKLNKSINSKQLPYSGDAVCIQRRRVRHNANYVVYPKIPGSISGPSTVICLHYKSYRAEHSQCGPSPVDPGRAYSPVYTWPTSSEPGLAPSLARCLAPIRACLHHRGRAQCQLDHQRSRPKFAPGRAFADRFC